MENLKLYRVEELNNNELIELNGGGIFGRGSGFFGVLGAFAVFIIRMVL
jgi:hypothetical protein